MELNNTQKLNMYRQMLKIRYFDQAAADLFLRGMVKGSIHAYIGQEAVAVGVCIALQPEDYITSTHRGHGHLIAKGGDLKRIMAEILGKATGYCGGRGGSMHVAAMEVGSLGAFAIVAAGLPVGVGAALASQMKGQSRVVICFFGEGATGQGAFHESVNMASVWKLPVVFVCENNLYAVSTHLEESSPVRDVARRATAYGMPGISVDGNDIMEVYQAAQKAVDRARQGEGPSLLECKTYRWEGHYVGEPRVYRSREEEEEWKKKCPILRFRSHLLEAGLLTSEEVETIEVEVQAEVEEAVAFAQESLAPPAEGVFDYLYA